MLKFLVIAFFPAFSPPTSGGELRLLNFYTNLAKSHDITLLTSTDFGGRFEEVLHGPTFREFRFPKDQQWRDAYDTLQRTGVTGELSGLAFAIAVSEPTCRLRRFARDLQPVVDVIVHEFPYSEPIFNDGPTTREVYNSHNFEASLLGSIVSADDGQACISKLLRLEHNLAVRADCVFATCEADANKFRLVYGVPDSRLALCPNGFDEEEFGAVAARRHKKGGAQPKRVKLLFMGSAHRPNVDAAEFVIELAAAVPGSDFIVAGGVSNSVAHRLVTSNVSFIGSFDKAIKQDLFAQADIFLNPVDLGSGTSLKAVEALAAGLPMISTEEGVRGLGLRAGQDALVVPRQGFAEAIRLFADNPVARDRIAASGRRLVLDTLAWSKIARGFEQRLAESRAPHERPSPLVLALNDYSLDRIDSGGKIRMHHLLTNLESDVVLVTFGETFDVRCCDQRLINITIPKTTDHIAFERTVNGVRPVSATDCVASLFAGENQLLKQVLAMLMPRAEACVFEHCYMAAALDLVTSLAPDMPVVYSAHNIEADLKRTLLQDHPAQAALAALVGDLEGVLEARADLVVSCTKADADHFRNKGLRSILVPNGSSVPPADPLFAAARGKFDREAVVGFVGSAHGPNVEAACFILRELVPLFPQVRFEILGGVCASLPRPVPPNVRLVGLVSAADKTLIMAAWSLALNPVTTGGGSSLKLPDYLSHGLATISTPVGARGFTVVEEMLGVVVPREGFARAMADMLADPASLRLCGENARRHALSTLDWPLITKDYRIALQSLARPLPVKASRALLVVTYRYTEPTLGGAEEYLVEVLERLRPQFGRIDLVSTDVHGLTNHYHFGTRYDGLNQGAATRIASLFDRALFFPVELVPETEMIERCGRLERAWTEEEHALFLALAEDAEQDGAPRLLAGLYGAENHEGQIRRWTSPQFSLSLPAGSTILRLVGYGSRPKILHVTVARREIGLLETVASSTYQLQTWFTLVIRLPVDQLGAPFFVVLKVDEHGSEGDHRPLGVLIESATVLVDPKADSAGGTEMAPLHERAIDLSEDQERRFRNLSPQRWLDGLLDVAERRAEVIEDDFAIVRGPHAAALYAWLAANVALYDVVLVQGIPFDIIPHTVETLARVPKAPRVVALPHFHADDRFYHWKRYRNALAKADKTLLFSRGLVGRLGPADRFAYVPGGGVNRTEVATATALTAFRAVHVGDRPFFLVLGRKTASKGYADILRAQAFCNDPERPDIVLIGPDEDGVPIDQPGVVYLGRQPREVVLGALATMLGLITMSESESFGIVLCEAWLFGKPVIANAACLSFRDLVAHGQNGLLVTTTADLAAAMEQLGNDPAKRAQMGAAGREAVDKHYSWDHVAEAVLALL